MSPSEKMLLTATVAKRARDAKDMLRKRGVDPTTPESRAQIEAAMLRQATAICHAAQVRHTDSDAPKVIKRALRKYWRGQESRKPRVRKPDPKRDFHAGYHQFHHEDGTPYGSFVVRWDDLHTCETHDGEETFPSGWYWAAEFPGCLPDGDPSGPFVSSTAAWRDAREND